MKGRIKVFIVMALMGVAFAYLIGLGLKEGSMFYFEVAEYTQKLPTLGDEKVRVNGAVVANTISYDMESKVLSFVMKDTKGPERINVIYEGVPPDLVQEEGVTVVAEGRYSVEKDAFLSSRLLVKCPSKYEKDKDKV